MGVVVSSYDRSFIDPGERTGLYMKWFRASTTIRCLKFYTLMSQNRNAHSVVIFPLGTHFLKDIPKWFLSQVSCYKLHDVGVPLSILFSPHGLSRIQEVEESEKGQSPHQAMSLHAPWLPDLKWFRVDDLCSRTVSIHSMVNCF